MRIEPSFIRVASTLDLGALGARLGSINFGIAVPAILGLVAVHLVAATPWRRLNRHLADVRLAWRTTIRLYYAGQARGAVTPANLGADVNRVMATTVPISPNGIGIQEGALAILFVQLRLPPDVALAAALLNRLALLLTAGMGATALAWGARRQPAASVRAAMTEPARGR